MAQIIGYRKDRLGARIIALGNLLFLEGKFGAEVRYLWPDGFESHDMAVENPKHPIFDPVFAAKYIQQIPMGDRPDIDDLTDIDKVRGRISTKIFEERLAKGERFLANEGIEPLLFSNELGPTHAQTFREALARIEFAEPIRQVLDEATAKLRALGETPLALHVRRGDVLDKDPWCHKNWVSKFAPDEFYEVVMDRPKTATLLFSDTPAAAARLASSRAGAITLDDLIDTPDLSEMQRDLVELLLMAQCDAVVAPSLSAFSSSAALMTGMGINELPAGLPPEERFPAYDRLLGRILKGPDSFHNTGDFAQSIGYAFGHALKEKKHHAVYDLLKNSMAEGQDYAFYQPLIMALAIACGAPAHAVKIHKKAKLDPHIWPDDLKICDALGCVAAHSVGDAQAMPLFLQLYLSRNKTAPHLDSLANYFFTQEPLFQELFMVDKLTLDTFRFGRDRERIFLFPVDDELHDGALNAAFPIWIPGADWPEMFERPQIIKNITKEPSFQAKRAQMPTEIKAAELAFFQDEAHLPTDENSLRLLSVYSTALALSGRYRRASGLMFHCRKHAPDNPLFLKRLANRFRATGHLDKVAFNLSRALSIAPNHPGLNLMQAELLQDADDHAGANAVLTGIADASILPFAFYKSWEKSLRKLKSRDAAKDVIVQASKRFPDHPIFEKQWKGKL